jgi:hypothetical protein
MSRDCFTCAKAQSSHGIDALTSLLHRETFAITSDPIAIRDANSRCGAVPGKNHVAIEIDLAEVRQFAIGRDHRPYIGKLEQLENIDHPFLIKASQASTTPRGPSSDHSAISYRAGVGRRHDADAKVRGSRGRWRVSRRARSRRA